LQDSKTPISVAYHIIDIYVEELERSFEDRSPDDEEPAPLAELLQPWVDVLSCTASKAAFQRVLDNVFDPVLNEIQSEEVGKRQKTDLTPVTLELTLANQPTGLDKAILERLFQAGAKDSTDPVARKRLYAYASKRGYGGDD
jgi:ribosomal RNA-processing protein 1